jgi:hypothetical protein
VFLQGTFFASYSLGLPIVQAIVEVDGVDEINRLLLADDVGTSERLVDVLSRDDTSSVAAFTKVTLPEGADFADGDFGAVTSFRALAPLVGTDRALRAVLGYDDDVFVIIERGSQRCGRFTVLFDTDADVTEVIAVVAEPGVVANEMTLMHLRAGVDTETARCAGLAQAATIPADVPLESFVGWQSIDDASFGFSESC